MPTEAAQRGFTLIEVLVALAVVVVAFLAMYGSAQQIVLSTTTQQERTFASWVAFDRLTELRLADELPQGDRQSGEIEMAGREWRYIIEFNDVDSDFIRQAIVRVSPAEEPDRELATTLGVLQIRPGPPANSGTLLLTSAGNPVSGGPGGPGSNGSGNNSNGGAPGSGDHNDGEVQQ